MVKNKTKIIIGILGATYILFWLPFVFIFSNTEMYDEGTDGFDTALVLGGLHIPSTELTPLNKERLDVARYLYEQDKIGNIIVSNTVDAASAMKGYLIKNGVDTDDIQLDSNADITSDSCRYVKRNLENESVIIISQHFHLPRALFLCKKAGVHAFGYAAEEIRGPENVSSWIGALPTRVYRYHREALLLNLAILNIYK